MSCQPESSLGSVIYVDNHSTTPCDPGVVEAMLPFLRGSFGNPSSAEHILGEAAERAVETARAQVANLLDCLPIEVIFTSGATESNNIAILGAAAASHSERRRIVTASIEHKSVLGPVRELGRSGWNCVELPVDRDGRVCLEAAREAIDQQTLLVSVQMANNEVGTVQSVREIAEMAHAVGALAHTDAAQALGKIPLNVEDLGVDLLSASSHKLYGPKGAGVLYVRGGRRRTHLRPVFLGGSQEHGLRPGTHNVPALVGFGEACRLAAGAMPGESVRLSSMRDRLESFLLESVVGIRVNGTNAARLPGSSSLTFPRVDAQTLIANCRQIALSTGSACSSGAMEPSHVLLAMGLSREEAYRTIRIGIGRFNTEDETRTAAAAIADAYTRLASRW